MQAGGQGSGYPHDQTKIDIFCILTPGGVLDCLNRPVGVLRSPLSELFGGSFPQADHPPTEGKDEQYPESCQHCDYQIQG